MGPLVKRERSAVTTALLLILVLHFVAWTGAPKSPEHECAHRSCPKRHHAMSETMRCHGQEPAPASCSIRAGCDCGRSHPPFAPHRQIEGVLPSVVAILIPDPFQDLLPPVEGVRCLLIRGPDSPPPRLLPA